MSLSKNILWLKKTAATSDIRLLHIFEIHKCLRDKPYKTEELLRKVKLVDESVNGRTIKADIDFLRKLGADIPKGNKRQGFIIKIPFHCWKPWKVENWAKLMKSWHLFSN